MFRDVYHKANDDIPVNNELLEKLKNTKPKKRKSLYPQATVAASIVIISAVVLAYPKIKTNREEMIDYTPKPAIEIVQPETVESTPEPAVTQNETKQEENSAESAVNKQENDAVEKTADNTQKTNEKEGKKEVKEEKPVPQEPEKINEIPSRELSAAETAEKTPQPVTPVIDKASETMLQGADVIKEILKPYQVEKENEQPAVNTIETPEMTEAPPQQGRSTESEMIPEKQGEVLGATSDEVRKDELVTETWTTEDYFEYLGREITPEIPSDLKEVTDKEKNMTVYAETGEPYFDSWTLKYESENKDRTVSLRLSKSGEDTTEAVTVHSAQSPNKQSQVVRDGVKCDVKATGLTDEEFVGLCDSI